MKPWLTIWKQPFLEQPRLRYFVALWLVGATAVTAFHWPQLAPLDLHSVNAIKIQMPGLFLATMGLVVWGTFIQSVDAQLSPGAVQLVPRLRPDVLGATLVLWLVASAVMALQTCVYRVPLAWVGAAILVLQALTLSRAPAMRLLGVLLLIVLMMGPLYGQRAPRFMEEAPDWAGWIAVAIAMALGAFWIVVQIGGPAEGRVAPYMKARERRRAWREQSGAESAWGIFVKRPRAQEWLFERVLRIPSAEARALQGLGPTFHWSQAAVGGPVQGVIIGSIFYALYKFMLLPLLGEQEMKVDYIFKFGPLLSFFFAVQLGGGCLRELHARHKEQALILMLPGAPNGGDVNGRLMRMLLARHLIAVGAAVVFVAALTVAFGQPPETALKVSAAPFAVAVLATPLLLRDYASMRRRHLMSSTFFALGLLMPLQMAIEFRLGLEPIAIILLALGLSAIVSVLRYVRILDASPAFPAGRLAQ